VSGICLFSWWRNSASVTAKALDLILARSATAERGVKLSFLICREGHLDSAGVTQLCWHRKSRPSGTPTLAAGRANAPAINTNQANTLRSRLICRGMPVIAGPLPRFKMLTIRFLWATWPFVAAQDRTPAKRCPYAVSRRRGLPS